jgi:hypothetical protein
MYSVPKNFPVKPPKVAKKFNKARSSRKAELKSIVKQLGNIAKNEIDRMSDFADELLTDESDNPLVLREKEQEYDDTDE